MINRKSPKGEGGYSPKLENKGRRAHYVRDCVLLRAHDLVEKRLDKNEHFVPIYGTSRSTS